MIKIYEEEAIEKGERSNKERKRGRSLKDDLEREIGLTSDSQLVAKMKEKKMDAASAQDLWSESGTLIFWQIRFLDEKRALKMEMQ